MENVRKHRDIEFVLIERRWNCLVSGPNYHTTKFFRENLLAIEMKKKTEIIINKPIYLGLSILELNEILMYKFCYDYVNLKMWWKSKAMLYGYWQFLYIHKSR